MEIFEVKFYSNVSSCLACPLDKTEANLLFLFFRFHSDACSLSLWFYITSQFGYFNYLFWHFRTFILDRSRSTQSTIFKFDRKRLFLERWDQLAKKQRRNWKLFVYLNEIIKIGLIRKRSNILRSVCSFGNWLNASSSHLSHCVLDHNF